MRHSSGWKPRESCDRRRERPGTPARLGSGHAVRVLSDYAYQVGRSLLLAILVADTLEELRAMLPPGLKRWERTSVMSPDVVEVWD